MCTSLIGEDGLEIQPWATPEVGPRSVRIDVRAMSVNFPDVLMTRGLYQARSEPPFVPGSECSGVVAEVGAEVSGLAVGDRVLAMPGVGAFATQVVVSPPTQQVHRIPDEIPFDEATAFNLTYGTAYHGLLRRGRLEAGESVLILGAAGGCGSAAIQVAKAVGARVVAVAGGAQKCALAESLGADAVIDHTTTASLSDAVKERTDGRGVDVVFDPVGGPDLREPLRSLAWNGRYLTIGFASGDIPTLKINQTILKGVSIVGVGYGMSAILDPAANAEDMAQLFAWYREGLVRPAIGHRFSFDDAADAVRLVHDRRAVGKVVIEVPA